MDADKKAVVLAAGKINLALNVGGVRSDGFHEVDMIMQQVAIFDTVRLTPSETLEMVCDDGALETDESNLCVKAFRRMEEMFHVPPVRIALEKRLPIAAGMAGGSADAAAVIRGLNELFDLGLPLEKECEIGALIGSDVPFCLVGGTARCIGRGEIVEKLPALPECSLVLVKPDFEISTPWSYRVYREETSNPPADLAGMARAIEAGDLKKVCACMGNQLAAAAEKAYPEIVEIRAFLESEGALRAMMTGSGPTVFGIFEDKKTADMAAERAEKRFPACRIIRCETLSDT